MLTNHQLLEFSGEHVFYEILMFFYCTQELNKLYISNYDSINQLYKNIIIEGFVLHLRNILAFLYLTKIKDDDVVAEYFFGNPNDWKKIRPGLPIILRNSMTRANKELAHLTTKRITGTPSQKSWPIKEISKEIISILKLFISNASMGKLHNKVVRLVMNAQI